MSNEKICAVEPSQKRACVEPFETEFVNACKEGDIEGVVSLAKDVQALSVARDKKYFNYSALFCACKSGKLEVVRYLCEELDFDPIKHDEPTSPIIHWPCAAGHLNVVKYLHESRQVSLESKNPKGWYPFRLALAYGRDAVVDYILKKVQIKIIDICKLHLYAVSKQKTSCVDYIWNQINESDIEIKVCFCEYLLKVESNDIRLKQLLVSLLNTNVKEAWELVAEYIERDGYGWIGEYFQDNQPNWDKVLKCFRLGLVKYFIKQLKLSLASFGNEAIYLLACALENPNPGVKECLFELACDQGHLVGVQYLYDKVSEECFDDSLKRACYYERLEVANFLFNKLFSKPNGWGIILNSGYCQLANTNNMSEIRFLAKLCNEAMKVENHGSDIVVTKKQQLAPLFDYAYKNDDILAAKYLFQLACEQGWLDEVQNLYDKVSKDSPLLDFTTARNEDDDDNCLKLACENEHVEVAKFLFEKLYNTSGGCETIMKSNYYQVMNISGLNKIEHLLKLYDRAIGLKFDPNDQYDPGFDIFTEILLVLEEYTRFIDNVNLQYFETGVKLCG